MCGLGAAALVAAATPKEFHWWAASLDQFVGCFADQVVALAAAGAFDGAFGHFGPVGRGDPPEVFGWVGGRGWALSPLVAPPAKGACGKGSEWNPMSPARDKAVFPRSNGLPARRSGGTRQKPAGPPGHRLAGAAAGPFVGFR